VIPSEVFATHGIQARKAGSWLAINAAWRSGENFSVHVHPVSGGWVDKVSGEKGNFSKLTKKLGLGKDAAIAVDKDVAEQSRQAESREKVAKQEKAADIYDRAYPIGKPLDPMVELYGKTASQKAYWRDAEAQVMNYLESRGGADAAVAAGARWATLSKGNGQKPEPCVVWPIRDLENGKLIGIQREWGRGHENKKMLGSHMVVGGESGGFVLKGNPDKVYLAEGMQTAAAVWRATGCMTVCLLDTAGMQSPPIKALQKGGEGIQVVFAGDRDINRAGQSAALLGAAKVASANPALKVSIVLPPKVGEDWADMAEGVSERLNSAAFTVTADKRRMFSGKAVSIDKGHFAVVDGFRKEIRVFDSREVDRMPEHGEAVTVARGVMASGRYNVTKTREQVLQRSMA
jgi:hypothetical protein